MERFKKPIRTEVIDMVGNEMTILAETEKAYLFVLSRHIKKGTSMVWKMIEREQWIPKSVWDNQKNFSQNYRKETIFNTPYFLR